MVAVRDFQLGNMATSSLKRRSNQDAFLPCTSPRMVDCPPVEYRESQATAAGIPHQPDAPAISETYLDTTEHIWPVGAPLVWRRRR